MRCVVASIGLGLLTSALLIVVLLGISQVTGQGFVFGVYVLSVWPAVAVVEWVVPDNLMYALVPDGGAPATFLFVLVGGFLQWGAVFSAAYWFLWCRNKSKNRYEELD